MKMFQWASRVFALLATAACTYIDYESAPVGKFQGSVVVLWVGDGDTERGDGKFVFVPSGSASDSFRFVRQNENASVTTIEPDYFYFDGGSIPRPVQPFKGLNPWGYAPAYAIHDWLFVARKCLNDRDGDEKYKFIEGMEFKESAEVLAEAIQTLIRLKMVSENDVAPWLISNATASFVSKRLWNERGACKENEVSQDHRDAIDRWRGKQAKVSTFSGRTVVPDLVSGQGDGTVKFVTSFTF